MHFKVNQRLQYSNWRHFPKQSGPANKQIYYSNDSKANGELYNRRLTQPCHSSFGNDCKPSTTRKHTGLPVAINVWIRVFKDNTGSIATVDDGLASDFRIVKIENAPPGQL